MWPFHKHRWYPYMVGRDISLGRNDALFDVHYVCQGCGETKRAGAWVTRKAALNEMNAIKTILDKEPTQ